MIKELYGSAVRILRVASNYPTFKPIYEDTRETARGLADNGYLEPVATDEYEITQKGLDYLEKKPAAAPQPPVKTKSPRKPRQPRVPTAKPQPRVMQELLHHPTAFARLRPRQKKMLRFIDTYSQSMGFPPTYREICEGVGIPSTSVVLYNIAQLVACGWLQRTEGVPRSLCLARELPGSNTKNDIRVAHGVLTITVNLAGKPSDVIGSARAAIARLETVIAAQAAQVQP